MGRREPAPAARSRTSSRRSVGSGGDCVNRPSYVVGLRRTHCIHVNDSITPGNARRDRHEHIGRGRIGRAGFARLVNDRRLADIPKTLETPMGEDGRSVDLDRVNPRRLRGMIGLQAPADRPRLPG